MMLDIRHGSESDSKVPAIKVTGMPGKHVDPHEVLEGQHDLANAVSLAFHLHKRND